MFGEAVCMPRCMILCELKTNFYCFLQNLFSYNFISLYIISGTNWKIKEKTNLFFSLANVYDKAHWRNAQKTRLHSYKNFCFLNLKMHQKHPIEMQKLSMSGFLLKPLTDEGSLNLGPSLPNIFLLKEISICETTFFTHLLSALHTGVCCLCLLSTNHALNAFCEAAA